MTSIPNPESFVEWLTFVSVIIFTAVFGTWAWVVRAGALAMRNEVRVQSQNIADQLTHFREDMAAERRRLYTEIDQIRQEIHQNNLTTERRVTRVETGLELVLSQLNSGGGINTNRGIAGE